eukprot:maker-scaffold84_size396325-snap-gene-1.19 protein:Tk09684 transcript:maker-scaffold84_size396325-snap-gene-1.19-mRNA-1 annotation:"hypothetical protein DAPPUDRAFT_51580"
MKSRNRYSTSVIKLSHQILVVSVLLIMSGNHKYRVKGCLSRLWTTPDPHPETSQARVFKLDPKRILRQCFGRYGCFSVDRPWLSSHRPLSFFPKSPKVMNAYFFLYTRRNPIHLHLLKIDDNPSLLTSYFDPNKMTFILTHGYFEHGHVTWLQRMKAELLINGDYNVIIMDWLTGSGPPYSQATANTRLIGVMGGQLLDFLKKKAKMNLLKAHCIGHSLGAHVCGYVGSYLKHTLHSELGRITGLDPAEPNFEHTHPLVRLDPSDAYFVDVIHTDANPITKMGLGLFQSCGHLDFYPNGGKVMYGCDWSMMQTLELEGGNMAAAFRRVVGCNHFRAYEYFIESINSKCPFTAVECPTWDEFASGGCNGCSSDGDPYSCDYMGFYAFTKLKGKRPEKEGRSLYVLTSENQPFCSYNYRVTIKLSDTRKSFTQGGDRGNFQMILNGDNEASTKLRLNKQDAFFEAGRTYHFMTTTGDLGHVKSADLVWEYAYHPLNPLTWRVLSESKMYVNRIEIEQFGHKSKHTFCAQDEPFHPNKPKRVIWRPTCRENAPDPGSSFLGSLLNVDPIGNAQFVFAQVNPLNMNPLNGLATIEQAFTGFGSSVTSTSASMRRLGQTIMRSDTVRRVLQTDGS